MTPEQRGAAWQATAERIGLDPAPLLRSALRQAERQETVWDRAMRGIRWMGARGLALAAAMGLTPRDGDPLVPERLAALFSRAFAAAQAVASAARELGEREAAFDRHELMRTALERGGPVTVADIEAGIALLEAKHLLLGNGERMVTTKAGRPSQRSGDRARPRGARRGGRR
ncbi:MAG: hypothetical protein NZM33_16830 [Bryobacteraceae bacterium]|nr:hypothetical protein [Bryobacteraceae bacterium]